MIVRPFGWLLYVSVLRSINCIYFLSAFLSTARRTL